MRAIQTTTLLSLMILAGCSAQPKALYQAPPKNGSAISNGQKYEGDWEGLIKFTLAKSQLVFDYKDKEKKTDVQMIAVPAEAEAFDDTLTHFALRQEDSWGVDTHLAVTKIDNTDLLASIGVETEDKRIKYIEAVGAVGVSVLGMMAWSNSINTQAGLPLSIDSYTLLRSANVKRDTMVTNGEIESPNGISHIKFQATFGPIKDDALDNSIYTNKANSEAQKTIFYSACRNITITFSNGPLVGQKFSGVIADPRYVQTIKYPQKGAIIFHSICGVNTTSSASGTSSNLDLLNAISAQYKSVRDEWKTTHSK
ncbi:hypothetical protein [Aeromonas hydrophila]